MGPPGLVLFLSSISKSLKAVFASYSVSGIQEIGPAASWPLELEAFLVCSRLGA